MSSPAPENAITTVEPLLDFTIFPKLPKELRLQIIETAIDGTNQRTFVVYHAGQVIARSRKQHNPKYNSPVKFTRLPVPALLHVNTETRAAATNIYHLSFSGPLNNMPVYFNYAKDGLFFYSLVAFQAMHANSRCSSWKKLEQQLRFMGIDEEFRVDFASLSIIAHFHELDTFAHRTNEASGRSWRDTGSDARLKSLLEGNWSKSHEYEELMAATNREANLIPEPSIEKVYKLPRVDSLQLQQIESIVRPGKRGTGV
ncbi:uncharacterized protein RSE6_04098 [Rhynchosporium secalis]|uniref:2EXR domain-containing protein n=1 Tax=Rhynchosporium secalis TaxID=38038 RepID=A0A1E1M4F1_RHYSE|nr:uncharacterized protein RSE6_04098 [Rhynchosporium secalis]